MAFGDVSGDGTDEGGHGVEGGEVCSLEAWVGWTEERLDQLEENHNRLSSNVSDNGFMQMKLSDWWSRSNWCPMPVVGIPYGTFLVLRGPGFGMFFSYSGTSDEHLSDSYFLWQSSSPY